MSRFVYMFAKTKVFTRRKQKLADLPPLNKVIFDSFEWFLKTGIREVLDEYAPIKDYTGKDFELCFLDYWFDEPKISELKARRDGLTYEASFRVRVRLTNKRTGEVKEQEVYLGELPMLTPKGTFIMNGVERVVISQLIRSSGVYFTQSKLRTKKLFGAKVLPTRGSWLEFDTGTQGIISVRIDKKRRVPVTSLLRVFDLEENGRILKEFEDIDKTSKFIEKTLKHDPAQDVARAYVEMYKRMRPGELAAYDNARAYIDSIFKKSERYDLGEVGRHKMNQRLYGTKDVGAYTQADRLLSQKDIVSVIREIIRLNNDPDAIPDDMDHLGNRRVKSVGEILKERMLVGMGRMRRIIQDKMSMVDVATASPAALIVPRPLLSSIRDFLMTSQLSQYTDQVNPLAQLEHKRSISSMGPGGLKRERAGFEVRDVHTSHYGRICPIETPEGQNIGLVVRFACQSKVNRLGFIETPYMKVKNGKISSEVVLLDAYTEEKAKIAHGATPCDDAGNILKKDVTVRFQGGVMVVSVDEVEYIDVSPQQLVSVAAGLIPFLENTDVNRALMGSNMQRQGVPCVRPEAPLVGTGFEERAASDSNQMVSSEGDGVVIDVDASHVTVKYSGNGATGAKTYYVNKFYRTNQYTCINQRPVVLKNQHVNKGDVLIDGESMDHGVLSLGQNLLVAFLPWSGYNFEDAVILSERLMKQDRFTSTHIHEHSFDVRETKLGAEMTTPDIPNVAEEKLKDLDEDGIVHVGAEVEANDILVGKITPRGEAELTAEEKLLRAIFGEKAKEVKDTSLRLEHGRHGRVIGTKVFSRERGDKLPAGVLKRIQVEVAELRKVTVGDKFAGRHGNKGVVSLIAPEEDMPYLSDGRSVDVVLNPLGVVKRMNIGQILETHLGWAAHELGYRAITPVFNGATPEDIKQELKKAGLPESGQTKVYDGKSGDVLGEHITVGYIYMMKLDHMVEDKIHMRSVGPYSLITQQPLGGKARFGGQRFGEMEVWALEGYGAAHTLQEILTIKSDDMFGRAATYESLIKGEKIQKPNIPASFAVLVSELKAMGFAVDLRNAKYVFEKQRLYEQQNNEQAAPQKEGAHE